MMKLCLWQGNVYDCSELFRPIETNFGKCCTFNMVPQTLLHRYMDDARDAPQDISDWNEWTSMSELISKGDLSSRKKFPRVQNRAGKVSGLAFLVDPDLEEYFCTASDSTGFRLATHLSTDVPHVTDFGLAIRPNYEHFVSVRPEITLADDVIEGISIEKRNCYMDGEFRLNYYNYYTSSNCMDECIANLTYEACNCVRYYMPRDHNRAICGPAKYQCAEDVKQKSFNLGVKNICQNCLPTCTEIKYFADATSTPFRRRVDLWADEYNKSTSWAKSNISIIHVYFGQDSSYARVRSQLYGFSDLVANFGGIMGLMCGFSGLSFIELIYFFSLRVWFRQRRKRHLRQKQELREAAERDRETALAYLGVGLSSSRRASIESARSNANNSISFKPISLVANSANEKDVDSLSSGYVSNSPTNLADNNGDDVVAVSKF
ncbi:Pickpocket protein 28 [Folsomia candida]|uniref:Pickpocket protein 28 n=2 Tax=Folsomia candida TaxID=158441 RepID=A0A226E3J8_FOLCA|nr:Pickpocket protein 28 [Folsomia candida]